MAEMQHNLPTSGPPGKRQLVIMITTSLLLAAGFAYYFFGYVKVKEASLNEMGFRVLSRLGSNIVSKKGNMIRNARNIVRSEVKRQPDITVDQINENNQSNIVNKEIRFLAQTDPESNYFPVINGQPGFIQVEDTVWVFGQNPGFSYVFGLENFIEPIIRKDFFDEYVLFSGDTTLYSTIRSGFELKKVDSLLDVQLGMQVSTVKQLEIGGISYQFFLQPHQVDVHNTWIVGGLIRKGKYNSARMGVSPVIIMFIFLFTILTIMSVPFLKLRLMNALERLNLSDAVFAVFSLVLGTSIVVILMLHTYRLGGPDSADHHHQLESFAHLVSDEFYKEIRAAYRQLEEFDSMRQVRTIREDVTSISMHGSQSPSGISDITARHYPFFGQAFWADAAGMQKQKWATTPRTTNKIDISGRKYFRNNLTNESWKVGGLDFSLESIYSWNTGKSLVGFGKKGVSGDDDAAVVAMSSAFYSVIDPIIPLGYAFAIVDREGKVWFHSDKSRNLQENLIEESEGNPRLRSAIYAHTGTPVAIKYHGENYDAHVLPLRNMPLYMIALREQGFDRTTRAQTLNFTLLHVFLFLIFLATIVILSRALRVSRSKLKKNELLFGWIWPSEKNKLVYQKIVIINIGIAFMLFVLTGISDAEESVALLYVASLYCFMITFFFLNFRSIDEGFFSRNLPFSVLVVFLILIINFYSIGNGFWMLMVFQLGVLGLLFVPSRILQSPRADSRNSYSLMLLSWIIITSIIPSVLFYRISYNLEHELAAKHSQLHMARKIANSTAIWNDPTRNEYLSVDENDLTARGDIHSRHLFDRIFLTSKSTIDPPGAHDETVYTILSSFIRPFYNEIVVQNNDLVFDQSENDEWYWLKKDGLQLVFTDHQITDAQDRALVIHSSLPAFHMPVIFGSEHRNKLFKDTWVNPMDVVFWFLILSIIGGLYVLIRFTVRNIFVQNDFAPRFTEIDEKLFTRDSENKNIFLIGLPKSGKTEFLHEKFPDDEHKLSINLIKVFYSNSWNEILQKALDPTINLVVVDHFEYNLENKELTQKKLELLEQLMLFDEKKIIVATSVHLTNIEELYTDDGHISEDDQEAIYRWTELFKNFYEVYFPLQGFYQKKTTGNVYPKQPAMVNELLENEFNHGNYLRELRPEIEKLIEHNEKNDIISNYDQIVMKIQSLCAVYYHSLWSTCTENEKYIIYDLAEDGLVNAKNFQTIELLLNKGLVVYDGSLQVMNESFRNFVLTKIGPNDALRMERKANMAGTWTSFRNPLIIVLAGLAAFLIITQQDSLNSMISFLAPFLALVPAAFRIVGFINRKKSRNGGGVGGAMFDDD